MIAFFRRFIPTKKPTKFEWAVVALIVVVLVALLYPQTQWAGSGHRVMPVVVDVFDAPTGKPIFGARVTITRCRSPELGADYTGCFPENVHEGDYYGSEFGKTNERGQVRLEHTFETSSGNSGHYVSLFRAWVCVDARGYGGVVVPVRHTPTRREDVVKKGVSQDIVVPIGLFRLDDGDFIPKQR